MGNGRNTLNGPYEGYPGIGAVHAAIPNHSLRNFLLTFADIADNVIGDGQEDYDPRHYYRVYDAQRMGLTVLEMDPSMAQAQKIRQVLQRKDVGLLEQDIKDQATRLIKPVSPQITIVRADSCGKYFNPGKTLRKFRRGVALFPDTSLDLDTHEMLADELGIGIEAIRRQFKQFMHQTDLTAHMTFVEFKDAVNKEQVGEIIKNTNDKIDELRERYKADIAEAALKLKENPGEPNEEIVNPLVFKLDPKLIIRTRNDRRRP